MFASGAKILGRVFTLAFVVSLPVALVAQSVPAVKGAPTDQPSKVDIGFGYSYLMPKGTVNTPIPGGTILPASYDNVPVGGFGSIAYYFTRNIGFQGEVGIHEWGEQNSNQLPATGTEGNNDGFLTVAGGIIVRFPNGKVTPFVHALAGGSMIDGPVHNPYTWGPNVTAGGGLDLETSWFHGHMAIRLVQADYEYMHANFGTGTWGGIAKVNAMRISAGIVFHAGGIGPPAEHLALACSATPNTVFAGDPVTVTAAATGLNPRLNAVYSFSGPSVTGNGSTATVATESLAPGAHTVDCRVMEGKPGKEGLQPGQTAEASDTFTVKRYDPPTISCSASPTTIKPGETSTISAIGISPQNRPLTYTYLATSGNVIGTGATAAYSSNGAATGTSSITCTASDDKGQTATAMTAVTISAPYVAPPPRVAALCSLSFEKDRKRPTRVDNEAKACLDEIALELQKQSDAKALLVGNSTTEEKALPGKPRKRVTMADPAAQRAVNAKAYLAGEKGIDASRIIVVTGVANARAVQDYLVPPGASIAADVPGTVPVDQGTVKAEPRKPLPMRD